MDGEVVPDGGGGGGGKPQDPPPFHVTVPSADIGWTGPGAPKDETVEDTTLVVVTDQTNQSSIETAVLKLTALGNQERMRTIEIYRDHL